MSMIECDTRQLASGNFIFSLLPVIQGHGLWAPNALTFALTQQWGL
jgi:hypothetical protein